MPPTSKRPSKPLVIGHRGASGYEPENTLRSFRIALEQGADGVEFDVHLSKDGVPVVIHDPTLYRTTNGKGFVRQKTLKELKALDAGKGETIPTLEEALKLVLPKSKVVLVELKAQGTPAPVVEVIRKLNAEKKVIVPSFHAELIEEMKRLDPKIRTGFITAAPLILYGETLNRLSAEAAMLMFLLVNKRIVEALHAAKKSVFVWTLNSEGDIKRGAELGVDGIVTNYPLRARKIVDSV